MVFNVYLVWRADLSKILKFLAPAGFKVVIDNVNVWLRRLMLVPEGLKVVGGMVENLGAESKKLVEKVKREMLQLLLLLGNPMVLTVVSVGGFAIAENSTLQDAIPSRSTI